MTREDVNALVSRVLDGDRRALSRVVTLVENAAAEGREALRLLYPQTGRAHTIGVTGPPGSGKSTLVCALARSFRSAGRAVGVVAVDPSSAFTQGALLGDRIRMQELSSDAGVFVRSMATRGFPGGLAATTGDVVAVLDAAGKDVVLVETVGTGQDEVEVTSAAQTTVLVGTPAAGDDIQAMKAGLLEAADILVVNKADLSGADTVVSQLTAALSLAPPSAWTVPVLKTVATTAEGVASLVETIESHRRYLADSTGLALHQREQARRQVLALLRHHLAEQALAFPRAKERLDEVVEAVAQRKTDPYSACLELLKDPHS